MDSCQFLVRKVKVNQDKALSYYWLMVDGRTACVVFQLGSGLTRAREAADLLIEGKGLA